MNYTTANVCRSWCAFVCRNTGSRRSKATMRKVPMRPIDRAAWSREHQELFGQAFDVSRMGRGRHGCFGGIGAGWQPMVGSNIRLHDGSGFDFFWPCPLRISALHYTHLSALLSSCSTFVFVAGRVPFPSCLCLFTYPLHMLQLQAQAGMLSMR